MYDIYIDIDIELDFAFLAFLLFFESCKYFYGIFVYYVYYYIILLSFLSYDIVCICR